MIKPEFLEILNSLISSGEVPGLYSQEEVENLFINNDILKAAYAGLGVYEAFSLLLQKNLRIVISMDHSSNFFAKNCAQNPALFSKCSIIWLDEYSRNSMDIILD